MMNKYRKMQRSMAQLVARPLARKSTEGRRFEPGWISQAREKLNMEAPPISFFVFFKNLSYIVAFLGALEYLNLSATAVSMLGILIIADFITGVLRAGIVEGKHAVRSSVGIRGMASKALVFTIPFVLAVMGKGVGIDLSSIATSSITVFCISTTYSILGNIHSISTGQPKHEFDAIDYVYQGVGNLLSRVIADKAV